MADKFNKLGDAPIEDKHKLIMQKIAQVLDNILNPGLKGPDRMTGFVLLIFPYGNEDGRANYISNGAAREDIVKLFKEQIARFEGRPQLKGHA